MSPSENADRAGQASRWRRILTVYRTPSVARGVYEFAVTLIPFAMAWYLMYVSLLHEQYWLYALLLIPAAGLLIRLFLIQHDCGHHAFFANNSANDWLGRAIGVLTLMPYEHWRRGHAIHHATHGNLARRGVGDVDTLTVAEYLARSRWTRLRYRAYRHPLVMFGIGPLFLFVLQSRLPAGAMRNGWRPWLSTMGTNVSAGIVIALLIWAIGWRAFLLVHAPIMLVGATVGVWLFYVQHQFEQAYWAEPENWNVHEGALYGSSHYDLPPVLKWFTANIGVHHVHHLSSLIPFYRLPDVLRDHPPLRDIARLTLWQSLKCVRLVLWDEQGRRMVSFKHLRNRSFASMR